MSKVMKIYCQIILIFIILTGLALFCISLLVFGLILPADPAIRVETAEVTTSPATTFNFNFVFRNHNRFKYSISYDKLNARLWFERDNSHVLASTHVAPFKQEQKNETTILVQFQVNGNLTANRIATEQFGVGLNGKISFIYRHRFSFRRPPGLNAYCDSMTFSFPTNKDNGKLVAPCTCRLF